MRPVWPFVFYSSALFCMASACNGPIVDARAQTIAAVIAKSDESMIRGRPLLVQTKYETMAASLFSFYRGTFPLYLYDAQNGVRIAPSAFAGAGLLPLTIGDAHPENFGAMRASDGTFAIEPNDFDAADRYPYLWEVRRLAIGMVIAARSSNPDDAAQLSDVVADEHQIARAVAASYATAIQGLDKGDAPVRLAFGGDNPVVSDIFERALEDAATRSELQTETILDPDDNHRSLVRGVIDPTDPGNVFADLPKEVLKALPETISDYRTSLIDPPDPSFFRMLDAVREYGAGVASLPKVRIIVLIDGPTTDPTDDILLELKELGDSGAGGFSQPPFIADDPGRRVIKATRTLWSRPDADPLWGVSELLGLHVQLKGEYDAYKGVKVKRLVKDRGTPASLEGLGTVLGSLLARMHASGAKAYPGTLHSIAKSIAAAPDRFADEQADVAVQYADVVEGDFARFQKVLSVLGPRMGIPVDPADAPPPDIAALFGTPPQVTP